MENSYLIKIELWWGFKHGNYELYGLFSLIGFIFFEVESHSTQLIQRSSNWGPLFTLSLEGSMYTWCYRVHTYIHTYINTSINYISTDKCMGFVWSQFLLVCICNPVIIFLRWHNKLSKFVTCVYARKFIM